MASQFGWKKCWKSLQITGLSFGNVENGLVRVVSGDEIPEKNESFGIEAFMKCGHNSNWILTKSIALKTSDVLRNCETVNRA